MILEGFPAQGLFLQIANTLKSRIVAGVYQPDERVPSVRDIAVEMQVNPNTAMRAIERLQMDNLIYNKRGMGYFVSPDAPARIQKDKKDVFTSQTLPAVFKEMDLLQIPFEELQDYYQEYSRNLEEKDQNR